MKTYIKILFLALPLINFSCETLVGDVPAKFLPNLEEKLVISSFISPQDTLVQVYVSLSEPLFSLKKFQIDSTTGLTNFSQIPNIRNAQVILSNGDISQALQLEPGGEFYFYKPSNSSLKITGGQKYTLRVQYEDKVVESQTIVPSLTPSANFDITPEIKVDSFAFQGGPQNKYYNLTFKIALQKSNFNTDFLRLRGDITGQKGGLVANPSTYELEEKAVVFSNRLFFENYGVIDLKNSLINSIETNGQTNLQNTRIAQKDGRWTDSKIPIIIEQAYFEVMYVTEDYFKFHESLLSSGNDNPFTEPTPIYSNIKGGLGIFAASNRAGKVIKFKDNKLVE